ncbi:uncharacterized protein LOC123516021 [Portunus trituberculatus]|uniref:uncharacterized protein LOC123516021 n=1 Tax=Portunus trituberculatus TaxID=210409 RepID=UPI001E1CBCFB|nr:uncharacterized protein LOC123516021 [Portunus trituberculatus]
MCGNQGSDLPAAAISSTGAEKTCVTETTSNCVKGVAEEGSTRGGQKVKLSAVFWDMEADHHSQDSTISSELQVNYSKYFLIYSPVSGVLPFFFAMQSSNTFTSRWPTVAGLDLLATFTLVYGCA